MRERRRITAGSVHVHAFLLRFVVDYIKGLYYNFIWCRGKRARQTFAVGRSASGIANGMGKMSVVGKTNAMGKRMENSVGVLGSESFWRNEATLQERNRRGSSVSCLTRRVQSTRRPLYFFCYLQERIVLAMECSPRQCRVAMELPATNCGGYTLRPADQRNETA
jgi:hypothetical protein